jgi:hypothetical protein
VKRRAPAKADREALISRHRRLKIEGGAFFVTLALADRGGDRLVASVNAWARSLSSGRPLGQGPLPLRLLSRFRLAGYKSGKGTVQQQFALLRALPCYV